MTNKSKHLTQLLNSAFNDAPRNQALIGLNTSIDYKELYHDSVNLANYLSANTDKHTVAIMLPNLLAFPVCLFGSWYADRTVYTH